MIKGNLGNLQPPFLLALEKFAKLVGKDMIITSGYRPGDTGQHGQGLAADLVCSDLELLDFYLLAERMTEFNGIGVYPTWTDGIKKTGGLHVDMRPGAPARWMGLGTGKSQQYVALTKEHLKLHGVI